MFITLISQEKIFSLRLPEKVGGKFWINDDEQPGKPGNMFAIEGDTQIDKWVIKSSKNIQFADDQSYNIRNIGRVRELILEADQLYPLKLALAGKEENVILLTEDVTEDRSHYHKFAINGNGTIKIGRNQDNGIIIDNQFVSGTHAALSFNKGNWSLEVNPKSNGTYVNRHRVIGNAQIYPGDAIFIIGVRIIIGADFFSINNPNGSICIASNIISDFYNKTEIKEYEHDENEQEYYYRSPRFEREIIPLELTVDNPPQSDLGENTPMFLTMAPAMLMGVGSFATGIISMINASQNGNMLTAIPTMIMSVSMLAGMIVFPFIIKKRDKRVKKEREQERRDKYLAYLSEIREEIKDAINVQREILRDNNPSIKEKVNQKDFWERGLWSKNPNHKDYLFMRIGSGNIPMIGELHYPEEKFSLDDDVLKKELQNLVEEDKNLLNVPVGLSLLKDRVLGITGVRKSVLELLNSILLQIFLLHSYDEIKVVLLCDSKDEEYLSYVKYAQHLWDNEQKVRFFATTEDSLRELSIILNKIVQERKEIKNAANNSKKQVLPHYVIVSTSKYLSNKCSVLSDILKDDEIPGFSVICAYDSLKSLPKECVAVVRANLGQGYFYETQNLSEEMVNFTMDNISSNEAAVLVQTMAQKQLDLNQGKYRLPEMLTFLDMFGVSNYEHLNVRQKWKNNNPVKSLQTAVGVDTNGETFYLDLHEKFHGPHGLVAGMTGSGKSEFIITYILSLAVNYHPDEVAFVLIDYKGGGLTGAFENDKYRLPHLAGTITNLDGGVIMRSILSIKSELRKRQAIFNKARAIANEGTMDIYKYQKMYRDGLVKEPMPHLFIISDEFAELKSQQPEFMDQLISTARIGRSLGVHLILATQKPAGVVNEQIWANSKFKVCLKVQDRADSMDMLKRPDAAEIAETGRFYLQVGYNELFEMGQSAWAGAPYYGRDLADSDADSTIEVIDELGNVVDQIKDRRSQGVEADGKQIVRIMEYLDQIAKEENIHERQLWMPEIPYDIRIDELLKKYDYKVQDTGVLEGVIGELDDPYNQSQRLLTINLTEGGNALIYGAPGSGKEMLLDSVIYSMLLHYTPDTLSLYLFDFGAELMRKYESAPHVGGLVFDGEGEKVGNFFEMVEKEVKRRKKVLVEYGGDIKRYNETTEIKLPFYVVVINNYSHFIESYERYEDRLNTLTRECSKYGIFFIITATGTSAVRYRLTQNFQQKFCMYLNDKGDYAGILGSTGGVYPPDKKGRGITKYDETYIFQTAHIVGETEDLNGKIKELCKRLNEEYPAEHAKRIPSVPQFVSSVNDDITVDFPNALPLGFSYENYRFQTAALAENNALLAVSRNSEYIKAFLQGIVEVVARNHEIKIIAFGCEKSKAVETSDNVVLIPKDRYEEETVSLYNIGLERNNNYKTTMGKPTVDMSPIVVILNGYESIRTELSLDARDKLGVVLARVESFCNMFFIVGDDYETTGKYSLENWVTEKCANRGVWLGSGLTEQIRFNLNKKTLELSQSIPDGVGYYIDNGVAQKMRAILPQYMEGKEDEK